MALHELDSTQTTYLKLPVQIRSSLCLNGTQLLRESHCPHLSRLFIQCGDWGGRKGDKAWSFSPNFLPTTEQLKAFLPFIPQQLTGYKFLGLSFTFLFPLTCHSGHHHHTNPLFSCECLSFIPFSSLALRTMTSLPCLSLCWYLAKSSVRSQVFST